MNNPIHDVYENINKANNIVILTGAGISTDSGIPDFRSATGLWNDHQTLAKMSKSYFQHKPKLFWPVFKSVFVDKMQVNIQPNPSHFFLKYLEDLGKNVEIFTQNVDSLHVKAGSTKVFEMHGNASTAFCPKHKIMYDLPHILGSDVPRCTHINSKGKMCNFILNPSVVLFGDNVKHYKEAKKSMKSADLLMVLGTSLEVAPVNIIPSMSTKEDCMKVLITNEKTQYDHLFDVVLNKNLKDVVAELKNLI